MADYCKQCSEVQFGEDFKELAGISTREETFEVLCEGCGEHIPVDPEGRRSDGKWLKPHTKEWTARLRENLRLKEIHQADFFHLPVQLGGQQALCGQRNPTLVMIPGNADCPKCQTIAQRKNP